MKVLVNGEAIETEASTLEKLILHFELSSKGKGIAVAVNDSVIPRTSWKKQILEENDRIEIIHAVQGG